jgi:hypothetical protein
VTRAAVTEYVRDLRREGYEIRHTPGGHLRIERADMSGPVFASSTPGERFYERKVRADLRRTAVYRTSSIKSGAGR